MVAKVVDALWTFVFWGNIQHLSVVLAGNLGEHQERIEVCSNLKDIGRVED